MTTTRNILSTSIAMGILTAPLYSPHALAHTAAPPAASTLDAINVNGMAEDVSKIASTVTIVSAQQIQLSGGNLGKVLDGLLGVR
ncbi:hypothetical protein [Stenotrophomonas sp. S39]|uniref:hypothetical protein n=1 Tax=Stenotrophomonas sp. S39 TaxID=2767451 RepID=UPI00190CB5C3|nr:hypothetical protein [Stenotrophomonas sp. S39]MBK0052683.1 hypothetical protein [Stenotrophomonas sp. S39]